MDPNEQQPEPTLPSAAEMRARRLAKLAAAGSASRDASSSPKPEEGSSSSAGAAGSSTRAAGDDKENSRSKEEKQPQQQQQQQQPKPKINITPAQTPKTPTPVLTPQALPESASETPFDSQSNTGTSTPVIPSGSVRDAVNLKRLISEIDSAAAQPATEPPARRPHVESTAEWTDHVLSTLFRVTVDPARTKDRHGHQLTFLPGLSQEIQDRGQPLLLAVDDIDPAILEAGTALPHTKPLLDYLLPCWKNITRAIRQMRDVRPERAEVLQEAKRLCMSNCIFALTMPEYFGREPNPEHDTLVPYLLRGLERDNGICLDFISEAVSRFDEDEDGQISGIFTKAMVDISSKLATMTMNDDYQPYVQTLVTYTKFKPLLEALANHPCFQMAQSAPNIEKFTLLGPFFRISPLQAEVAKVYFAGPRTMDPGRVNAAQSALQMTLATHQVDLHNIAMAFARAGDKPRNKLLDWFAYIMNVNHKRRAIQVNQKEVSSDAFMMNVSAVLDRMCEPFMEANFSRMERIDIDYLRRNPRVDISDETKLNADQAQAEAFYAKRAGGESKFVSELFFLNMAAHHYGSGAAHQKFKDMDREIKYMERQLALLEEQRKKSTGNPMTMAVVEQNLKNYTNALEKHIAYKLAVEGVLSDEKMQQRALMFMRYVSVWLLRVASQTDYTPDKQLTLPLPAEEPEAFSCLPEYVLQNVVDHFKFVFRRVPRILLSAVGDEMVTLCITFLESSEYIHNPYLKSSLVSLLYSGTWRIYHLSHGVLGDALTNSKFANKYLLHALMKFYIECESTGAHTQFYDKFNIRYEIFQVIKVIWPNDVYKQQLTEHSKTNRQFFVRFVNLLLNDATYVLDEALTRFPKIHDLQKELQDNKELTPEERQRKEGELQQAEGQAQSYMQLANETVSMMKLFTEALADAFTMPEIVSRLAGMLDYNLVALAGPKSRNLKVENPEKYFFNPKVLLPQLIDLYLNLGSEPSFIEAVGNDGRSYKPDIFDNASRILATKGLTDPEKLAAWNALKAKFAEAKEAADQAELDFGDVPAEFEDPIMGDLMRDPVVLPSRHVVDRSTIMQHLLSDPKDPFTRQPMTIDDAVPATELREQIERWKAERIAASRAAKAKAAEAAAAPDAMDISED